MSDGGATVTDIDTLQGQALADAVAVEVMGWEFSTYGQYWSDTKDIRAAGKLWHPESRWSSFGVMVDRMHELGLSLVMTAHPPGRLKKSAEVSVEEWSIHPGPTPLVYLAHQAGDDFFETGCRAALKAVRAKEGSA